MVARWDALAALLLLASCDAAPTENHALHWQRVRAALAEDGMTQPVRFAVSEVASVFALRAYPVTPRTRLDCFALREVVINETDAWVGADSAADSGDYCTTCEQRVSIGRGYGLAVLPSSQPARATISSVSARIGLRDCQTLTPEARSGDAPSELWIELSAWPEPDPARALELPVAVVIATRHGLADPSLLPAALATLRRTWASADIHLQIAANVQITAPDSPLLYSALDQAALVQLSKRARAAVATSGPVFVLTPCLIREDTLSGGRTEPWALTPHLPGGFAVSDQPDQIFVAAERCEGLTAAARFSDPELLGAVMTHELGHYLGLYHVAEHDGRQDMLTDTAESLPNLMQVTPSPAATTLSPSQISVARRHVALANSPD
jgi:hypothetical protein